MTTDPDRPAPDAATRRPRERPAPVAVERWENEGGHLRGAAAAPIAPTDVSRPRDPAADGDALGAMRAKFLADFADGTMGREHNTYRHRLRVLQRGETR